MKHSQLIVSRKFFGWKLEMSYTKKYMRHLGMPPKISLKHDRMKELGSEVARQAEGSQPTQPNPNPNHDRTGRPVAAENTSRSSNQEIDTRFSRETKNANLDEDANHDRTGRPVVCSQPVGSSSTIQRGGHRLQNIWIATFCCETSRKFSCS